MSQCVPSWDLQDINPIHDVFKLDYEVAELTWENGQLAMHELGPRRVPTKSQATSSWDKPRAAETLEAIVNPATLQPYCKTPVAVNGDELVPWLHHHNPTVTVGSLNASATMTSDALVPSSNNRIDERSAQAHRSYKSTRDAGCSTRVDSCSGDPSAFMDPRVARGGGGTTAEAPHDWSSCRDMSVCGSGTFVTPDTYDGHLGGRRLKSTSTGSPEHTSSGRDCSNSTFPDDSACHCRTQREAKLSNEKKKEKVKSLISNKRRRTAAIHNQSERKRRDKINQRMKTLQKLVPNSSKTDKSSMLEEVIEYIKQLQAQVHMGNLMNMSPMMMMPLAMQQQHQQQLQIQIQKSMLNSMGIGMGMGGMDMNTIGRSNIPAGYHPSTFMHLPSWNNHATHQVVDTATMAASPMSAFLACRPQTMNMDSYGRMAALYQHMQNQPSGPFPKN